MSAAFRGPSTVLAVLTTFATIGAGCALLEHAVPALSILTIDD